MGLTFPDAKYLFEMRRHETGGKAVTLGRLSTYFHPADLKVLRSMVGSDAVAATWLDQYKWGQYADGFFTDVLRFDTIDSIDFSAYEGAPIVHDIGERLPKELEERFDLAVDGGTLEHVFNFPVAMGNLMKLVKLGGVVYSNGPSNNLCGHGFYQFSPELMHRIFAPANGFELLFVRLVEARYVSVELSTKHRIYDVRDPAENGHRINVMTARPVAILSMARRTRLCEPFAEKVLQSDYVGDWKASRPTGRLEKLKEALRRDRPQPLLAAVMGLYMRRKASLGYRQHFRRVS